MVVSLARSLSLVAVSTVAGINGGLSISGFGTVSPATHERAQGGSGSKRGGRPWSAAAAFLPSMPLNTGLGFFGVYSTEESSSVRQAGLVQWLPLRSECICGNRRRGGHDDCTSIVGSLCSAFMLRGGEIEAEREIPRQAGVLSKHTGVAGSVPATASGKEFAAQPRTGMWRHSSGSRGPRSLSSIASGIDEASADPRTTDRVNREPPTKAGDKTTTRFVAECLLPTSRGEFRLRAYRHEGNGRSLEPVVMMADKTLPGSEGVPVRVHDQCLTSEVLGSLRCDCKQQLELALDYINEHGGCIIYMQQEGRGIGLANKVAAYALQDGGLDTVDANRHLGFEDDLRSYEAVEYILADMGIKSVKLMTNNPFKLKCLKAMGINVLSRIPMLAPPNQHSLGYLQAKADRMSHLLHQLDDAEIIGEIPMGGTTTPVSLSLDEVGSIRGGGIEGEGLGTRDEEDGYAFGRDSVLAAIEAVREGKCVVVTDDEGRENEGDLVFAAEKATEDLVAFTIRHTSGVICAALEEARLEELRLPQMVVDNEDPKMTAFTITVDAKEGTSTGISAGDRATTLRALANSKPTAADFNRPGHIFPLRYTAGGVIKRGGHTEAALDLSRLAGLQPVGALCEITTKDGKKMARVPELREFCAEHGLVLTSIQDLRCLIREIQSTECGGDDSASSYMLTR